LYQPKSQKTLTPQYAPKEPPQKLTQKTWEPFPTQVRYPRKKTTHAKKEVTVKWNWAQKKTQKGK